MSELDQRYAPPQADLEGGARAELPRLTPSWGPMELLRVAGEILVRDLWTWALAGGALIGFELCWALAPEFLLADGQPLTAAVGGSGAASTLKIALPYLALPVTTWLRMGLLRMALHAVRGEAIHFGLVFSEWRKLLGGVLLAVFARVGGVLGTCLLIVPGVMFQLGTSLGLVRLVDRDTGPIDGLTESWDLMEGQKMTMFLCLLVLGPAVVLASVVSLGLGLAFIYPLIAVCLALIYELTVRAREA